MTALPIPFVTAFLLVTLVAANHATLRKTATGRVFALVLYLNALSMVLIGFRWTKDMVTLLPLVATIAIVSAALLYLAFTSLGRSGTVLSPARDWPHLVPVALVAMTALLLPAWADVPLIGAKSLYAVLMIRLARRTPDSLSLVRLGWLNNAQHALWGAAVLLVITIALDIAIMIDFARYDGRHSANLVGYVSLAVLLLLGYASVLAGRGRVQDSATDMVESDGKATDGHESNPPRPLDKTRTTATPDESTTNLSVLLEDLDRLLVKDRLYADPELNLQRLARKAGVPARAVSRAINTHKGQNISQWVNSARIDAACALLSNNDITITEAMLAAGFTTKSNFNREFRRIMGCSPSEWREAN